MSSRRSQQGQTLILIMLGAWLIGGSAAGGLQLLQSGMDARALNKALRAQVADGGRRARLDGIVDLLDKETRSFARDGQGYAKDALDLMGRHDATRAQFDALYARADAQAAAAVPKLLELRSELRESLSDEEWKAVFANQKR